MAIANITFVASASSNPADRMIMEGIPVGEYLRDGEGITDFNNITIEVNGAPANLNDELEDGDTVALIQKKTASGAQATV